MMVATKPTPTNPVTLNLFQGPLGRKRGARRTVAQPIGMLATAHSGCAEKWALKQVQGDDDFYEFGGKCNHSEQGKNALSGSQSDEIE